MAGRILLRYTPEPIKNWADYMENEELERNNRIRFDTKKRFKRKLLLSDKSDERHLKTKEPKPILTDEHRLAQRQKQIDFGKNTAAYGRYIIEKPRHCRSIEDPRTPDKFQVCSTRSWTGQIRCWRRKLHEWDPPSAEDQVDTFALVLNSNDKDDVNSIIKWKQNMGSSSTSQNSSEDFFHDLQIDECLLPEKLCI